MHKKPNLTAAGFSRFARILLLASCLSVLALPSLYSTVVGFQKAASTTAKSINVNPGNVKVVLCSAGPFTVQQGDVISSHSQMELTYSDTEHFMVGSGIVLATSNAAVDSSSTGYIGMISKFATSNHQPLEDINEIHARTGSYLIPAGVTTVYVNWVAYAASLGGSPANASVPAGYAEVVGVVERNITRLEDTSFSLTSLPIDATTHVQYSLGPTTIPANTMVDIRFQVEGTSEAPSSDDHQRLGRYTIQTTSATSTSGSTFTEQSQASVPRYYEHHHTWSHVGGRFYSTETANAFFNSVLYGRGTATTPALDIAPQSSTLYGHFVVEMRPTSSGRFWEDKTINATSLSSTQKVIYSVGPISCQPDDVVEVRYVLSLRGPSSLIPMDTQIIRATSATATSGTVVQRPFYRGVGPGFDYIDVAHSTAEQFTSSASGQYYNLVAWLPNGGSVTLNDWGELEAVKR